MTTDVSSTTDINSLTASLKERLNASIPDGQEAEFWKLRDDVLAALELLVLQAETVRELESTRDNTESTRDNTSYAREDRGPAVSTDELACRLTDALDDSLSQWQVQISASFTQAVARDLKDQCNTLGRLTDEAREHQRRLDEQRQAVDLEMAEALKLKSRFARQRKTLAKEIRAQRAEMLLQIERNRNSSGDELESSIRKDIERELRLEYDKQFASLQNHGDPPQALDENLQNELEALAAEARRLQAENEELKAICEAERNDDSLVAELQRDLRDANELLAVLEKELSAKAEASQPPLEQTAELEAALARAQLELVAAHEQIEELNNRPEPQSASASPNNDRLDQLEDELYKKHLEIQDLGNQNSDLAAQIAKRQVDDSGRTTHISFNQESLTWEERKKIIMQQLECEHDEQPSADVETRQLEISDILSATQLEIERRDREIDELKSIVEQQSNTHEGIAVGAAAIAQMIDSDELVNQERQKLKDIQQEWEMKLRKAEIDLSLERAKLARERTQLETELEKATREVPVEFQAEVGESKAQTRTRKWLAHLGLKDGQAE